MSRNLNFSQSIYISPTSNIRHTFKKNHYITNIEAMLEIILSKEIIYRYFQILYNYHQYFTRQSASIPYRDTDIKIFIDNTSNTK